MRLWFDTNACVDNGRYSLSCAGTRRDLAALGIELRAGMPVTLYMEDEDGRPCLLLVDAIVEPNGERLVARVDGQTWRREPGTSAST